MKSNTLMRGGEMECLQKLVFEYEEKKDFASALHFQTQIAKLVEGDPTSTAGELGESFFRLGSLAYNLGNVEEAVTYLCKSLGFRRLFFGKGHQKVVETMDLIKLIRSSAPKKHSNKVDRRTAEYRRSVSAKAS
jgi:hypothetical protein